MDEKTLHAIVAGGWHDLAFWVILANVLAVLANAIIALCSQRYLKGFENRITAVADRDATRYNFRYIATATAINKLAKMASLTQGLAADYLMIRTTQEQYRSPEVSASIDKLHDEFLEKRKRLIEYKNGVKHLLDDKIRLALVNFEAQLAITDTGGTQILEIARQLAHDGNIKALEELQAEFTRYLRSDDGK